MTGGPGRSASRRDQSPVPAGRMDEGQDELFDSDDEEHYGDEEIDQPPDAASESRTRATGENKCKNPPRETGAPLSADMTIDEAAAFQVG